MKTPSLMHTFCLFVSLFLSGAAGAAGWQEKIDDGVLRAADAGDTAEFLIYLSERADLSGAAALRTKEEKGRFVYEQLTDVAARTQAPVLSALDALGVDGYRPFWITNTIWARGDRAAIETLAQREDVEGIYSVGFGLLPEPVEESPAVSQRATRAPEASLTSVKADQVWALGFRGQGAVVANADTGVQWDHPALKDQYRGWDGITVDHDYNWFVGATQHTACPNNSVPCDDDSHGSHTMGTIVGDDGVNNQIGMAPEAAWIACRNMDLGFGVVPTYMACMEWFIAPTDVDGNNPDPSMAPHVVSNSWSCLEGCPAPALKDSLAASVAAGIFYTASAGNRGSQCSTVTAPIGIYKDTFTVAATNNAGVIASFSSRGPVLTDFPPEIHPKPDISAPGVTIRSSTPPASYGNKSGTSMSAPHVAGLVALIISANPSLAGQVQLIRDIIQVSAEPKFTTQACGDDTAASSPNNVYGYGQIDALAAVQLATADADSDGVADIEDNCRLVPNPSQCNTDGDAYGNHCDPDLNNNGVVNFDDLGPMKTAFFSGNGSPNWNPHADLTCNDVVNFEDLGIMRSFFFQPPGPGATPLGE